LISQLRIILARFLFIKLLATP